MKDLKQFLKEVLEYIIAAEEKIEGEWGYCRIFSEIEKDGDVPEIYYDCKEMLNGIESTENFHKKQNEFIRESMNIKVKNCSEEVINKITSDLKKNSR